MPTSRPNPVSRWVRDVACLSVFIAFMAVVAAPIAGVDPGAQTTTIVMVLMCHAMSFVFGFRPRGNAD